jgi:hypothetical protein
MSNNANGSSIEMIQQGRNWRGAGGAIAPPPFGRIEGAAGSGGSPP